MKKCRCQQDGEDGRQTQRKRILPEYRKTQRGQLITESRFLEVTHPVETRGHPVAGFKHFARDFRITELIRADQRADAQRQEIGQQKEQHQQSGRSQQYFISGKHDKPPVPHSR